MYNFNTFNGIPTQKIPNTYGEKSIMYGDLLLHDDRDMRVHMIEFLDGKKIQVDSQSFENDGDFFNRRETIQSVQVLGSIRKENRGELLNTIDIFKEKLSKEKAYFVLTEGEWSRRVLATVVGVDFKEKPYTVDWIEYSLTLQTFKYWEDAEVKEVIIENLRNNHEYWVARDGTAEAKITTILAFTSGTASKIEFGSENTKITIEETFTRGDNLTIDGENQRVLKNGVAIGFRGEIPLLKNPTNKFVIKITGNLRYNLTAQYHLTYK